MLQASPSLGLAKFLWSKPAQTKPAAITVSMTDTADVDGSKPSPMTIDVTDISNAGQVSQMSDILSSNEGDAAILKIAGLKDFWGRQMKVQEDKWKLHYEQMMMAEHNIDTETAQVNWEAVRGRIAYKWQSRHEKPENMSDEEWQNLQEMRMRPWLIYKLCGLYTRLLLDPECRPIFQEFDFY